MGSIGSIGGIGLQLPHLGQDFGHQPDQAGPAGQAGAPATLPGGAASQGPGSAPGLGGGNSGLLNALQAIGDELAQLEQLLKTAGGGASGGSSAGGASGGGAGAAPASAGTPAAGAPSGPASGAAPAPSGAGSAASPSGGGASPAGGPSPAPASAPAPAGSAAQASTSSPAPASGQAPSPQSATGGAKVDIDGGNSSGHGVTEKVDNNTGAAASFGWENAQGKLVGKLDLQNGQSGSFNVNADGPDGKSARLIKLNGDGSIPDTSNLDETNLDVNKDGSLQVSPDVSQITKGSDATQIKITDGDGKSVGNGAAGGAYQYPTQDTVADPKGNPMTMAMDKSNFYDNSFSK